MVNRIAASSVLIIFVVQAPHEIVCAKKAGLCRLKLFLKCQRSRAKNVQLCHQRDNGGLAKPGQNVFNIGPGLNFPQVQGVFCRARILRRAKRLVKAFFQHFMPGKVGLRTRALATGTDPGVDGQGFVVCEIGKLSASGFNLGVGKGELTARLSNRVQTPFASSSSACKSAIVGSAIFSKTAPI